MILNLTTEEEALLREMVGDAIGELEEVGRQPSGALVTLALKLDGWRPQTRPQGDLQGGQKNDVTI